MTTNLPKGTGFVAVHPSLPIFVAPLNSVTSALQAQIGNPVGTLVALESQGATGTLYTVPANKTFTGVAYLAGAGAGAITVSAATGGAIATLGLAGTGGSDAVPVTVAGGGTGNAISVATSGSAAIDSVLLVGHVK